MNVRDREKWKFSTTLKLYSLSCFVTVITIKMIYTLVQCQSGTEKHWDYKPLLGRTLQPAEARATSCLDADNAHLPVHVEMLSFQLWSSTFHLNWPTKLPGSSLPKIPKMLHGFHGKCGFSLGPETTMEMDMEGLGVAEETVQYNRAWRSPFAELHIKIPPNHGYQTMAIRKLMLNIESLSFIK